MTTSTIAEPPIIAIVGPTATGKTAAAIRIAEAFDGEIISADSQAVYRGMDIGTAKPDAEERACIPFHLLDAADPDEPFTVARFRELAEHALSDIRRRSRYPLLAGGTGLYVKALLENYGLTETPADPAIRERLNAEAAEHGAPALHERLEQADPAAAAKIHPNDRIRIVRALEVLEATGIPISVQQARDAETRIRRPALKFGLTASRDALYRSIDQRVDRMIAAGFVQEVKNLLAHGYTDELAALRSLGYKEICAHLRGQMDLEAAIAEIKLNTRRFAKRQLTWFRADVEITWIDVEGRSIDHIANEIISQVKPHDKGH